MKALIIDPALHSMGGHHYNAVSRLQDELSALGVGQACLASAYADGAVTQRLGATPTFTRSVYGRTYSTPDEFAQGAAETTRQLARALGGRDMPADLVILPCCDQVLASAMARHLARRRFAPRPHILLWILYGPHHGMATDDPLSLALRDESRAAFAGLKDRVGHRRIRAYCETPPLAQFYRALLDLEVRVMPGPGLALAGRTRPARAPGRPATIVCLGFANRPKGYQLLPAAVDRVLRQHRDARFVIHGIVDGSDAEDNRPVFARLSALGERVCVRQGVLAQEDYKALLAQADLLLLPYDPVAYRSRGSGVFTDAHALGIPVIATEGCAFARPAFEGGWGTAIVRYDGEGVGEAVLSALAHLRELTAGAARAAGEGHDGLAAVLAATVDVIRAEKRLNLGVRLRQLLGK